VAAGDARALDAVLLLNFGIELIGFDSAAGSRFGILVSVVVSAGPLYDLKLPGLRIDAWLGDAEKLEGLTSVLAGPAPLDVFGVPERPLSKDDSGPPIDGRFTDFGGLGLGGFARMLVTFGLRFLPSRSFTTFLPTFAFLMAGAAEAGVEPLRILIAGAGLSRGAGAGAGAGIPA
jgi:hypothetical protein